MARATRRSPHKQDTPPPLEGPSTAEKRPLYVGNSFVAEGSLMRRPTSPRLAPSGQSDYTHGRN